VIIERGNEEEWKKNVEMSEEDEEEAMAIVCVCVFRFCVD
jgi:hypothetical protein